MVDECRDCGLGFLNPRPSWNELQEYYDEDYAAYEPSHGAAGDDDAVIAQALQTGSFRHLPIPEGKKVLDVGTGGGFFLRICSKLGARTWGVEPSPIAAEVARSAGLTIFNGTLDEYETAERFDIITASQVLEHVSDPVATLAQMRELLAPGGLIWIAVPNAACRWAAMLGWKWDGADLPYHLLQFTPESLRAAGQRAGLRTRRIFTESRPGIVRYSMQKYLRETFFIPKRLSRTFLSNGWAIRTAQKLDARKEGDNLIIELEDASGTA
jgi:SAM-dependent methyltransferase